MKMHFRDLRLAVNAGMTFPACYAGAPLLDTDKGRLPSTHARDLVTCKRCQRIADRELARYGPALVKV